jgi:hypothetical protein
MSLLSTLPIVGLTGTLEPHPYLPPSFLFFLSWMRVRQKKGAISWVSPKVPAPQTSVTLASYCTSQGLSFPALKMIMIMSVSRRGVWELTVGR